MSKLLKGRLLAVATIENNAITRGWQITVSAVSFYTWKGNEWWKGMENNKIHTIYLLSTGTPK